MMLGVMVRIVALVACLVVLRGAWLALVTGNLSRAARSMEAFVFLVFYAYAILAFGALLVVMIVTA